MTQRLCRMDAYANRAKIRVYPAGDHAPCTAIRRTVRDTNGLCVVFDVYGYGATPDFAVAAMDALHESMAHPTPPETAVADTPEASGKPDCIHGQARENLMGKRDS